jgi:hypothetical protein
MYFEQEAMIVNITLSISIGNFRIKTNFQLKNLAFLNLLVGTYHFYNNQATWLDFISFDTF